MAGTATAEASVALQSHRKGCAADVATYLLLAAEHSEPAHPCTLQRASELNPSS